MKPETRHTSLAASPVERLPDRISPHRTAITAHERPIRPCPRRHVLGQDRHDMRRDDHSPPTRIGLRLGIEGSAVVLQQLDTIPANCHRPGHQVNISRAQAQHLTAAQATPGGQQHAARYRGVIDSSKATTSAGVAIGRSLARSEPAPGI
jgi:hypothetical protein